MLFSRQTLHRLKTLLFQIESSFQREKIAGGYGGCESTGMFKWPKNVLSTQHYG